MRTDIPNLLPGSRVLVSFFGGKRQNMTLGFPTDLPKLVPSLQRIVWETGTRSIPWKRPAIVQSCRSN